MSSNRPLPSPLRVARPRPFALCALGILAGTASAQKGDALLDAPLVALDTQHRMMLTLDYDQDGFEDAVGYWWEDDYYDKLFFRVYLNDGAGTLVPTYTSSIAGDIAGPSDEVKFFEADLNGDPLPDFIAVFSNELYDSHLYAYEAQPGGGAISNGMLGWWAPGKSIQGAVFISTDTPGVTYRAMLIDDQLLVHRIVENPGGGGSGSITGTYTFPTKPDFIELEDWTGEGDEDLFVHAGGSGYLFILDHDDGSLYLIGDHPHGLSTDPMVAMGDIDGDGDRDVVAFQAGMYAVLRRTNINRFLPEPPLPGGPATHLGDIDGDGDLDGLCCGGSGGGPDPVHNDVLSKFEIALNDGTGAFAPAFSMPGLGATRLAGAADLDHDGNVDLVAGRCVYYASEPITAPPLPKQTGVASMREQTGDVDGDGDPDFEFGLALDARNRGDGMLQPTLPWLGAAPAGMRFVGPGVCGDFDGDGDADVVAPMEDLATNALAGLRFLANNGGGGFADGGDAGPAPPNYDLSDFASKVDEVVVGDADGDGDLDIVWPEAFNTSICSHVFWNQGSGSFLPGPVFWIEHVLHVADFTGDEVPDLIVGNFSISGDTDLFMRVGLGGGVFDDAVVIAPWFDAFNDDEIAVADYDLDGDLDMVFVRHSLSVAPYYSLTNDGSGNFLYQSIGNTGTYGHVTDAHIALADMTGDGLPDVVVGPMEHERTGVRVIPRSADGLSWLTGSEAVTQVVFEVVGSQVLSPTLAVDDLDGDGDPDLNTGLLVRGSPFMGPAAGMRLQLADGVAAASGMKPTLGATGPFRVGEIVTLRLSGAPGQAAGTLVVTTQESAAAPIVGSVGGAVGGVSFRQPVLDPMPIDFTTSGTAREPGSGGWSKSLVVTPSMAGQAFELRARLVDPATGLATVESNTLVLTYGE